MTALDKAEARIRQWLEVRKGNKLAEVWGDVLEVSYPGLAELRISDIEAILAAVSGDEDSLRLRAIGNLFFGAEKVQAEMDRLRGCAAVAADDGQAPVPSGPYSVTTPGGRVIGNMYGPRRSEAAR